MTPTRTYSPGGKGHRMLGHLADHGCATSAELVRAAYPNANARRRKRARPTVVALAQDGFIWREPDGTWALRHEGAAALSVLRRGHPVTTHAWREAA